MIFQSTPLTRRRILIGIPILGAIIVLLGALINPLVEPGSTLAAWVYLSFGLATLLYIASAIQAIQGKLFRSATLFIFGVFIGVLFEPFIHDGFGIIWGVIFLPTAWLLASMTQETSGEATRITILSTILFSILIAMDLFFEPLQTIEAPASGWQAFLSNYFIWIILLIVLLSIVVVANFRSFSLQTKFVIATTFLAVTGVVVTTFAVTRTISQIVTEDLQQDLQNLSQFRASTLGNILSQQTLTHEALKTNRDLIVAIIQSNQELDRLTRIELREELTRQEELWDITPPSNRSAFLNSNILVEISIFQASFTDHRNVIVTNQYGLLVSSTEDLDDIDMSSELWWQGAYWGGRGRIYIGNPIVSQKDNTIHIPIATPIYPTSVFPGQAPIGILYTEYDFTDELAFITDQEADELVVSLVINNFIAETNIGDLNYFGIPLTTADITQLSNDGFITTLYKGEERLLGYRPIATASDVDEINQLSWGVLVSQSVETAQEVVTSQQTAQATLGIIIVIIGIFLAILVARVVSGPIIRLAEVANRLASGEIGARATLETGDEIASLATTLNQLADNTEENIRLLQSRVNERTQALETSFRISRTLSTILNQRDLADEIVKQLQTAFNFYHVHVYFLNDQMGMLQMVSGSGEVGQELLEKGHAIPLNKGLVGEAATSNTTVFVADVRRSQTWVPNELLPDTTAEIAVPIAIGESVFGVIDVQENRPNKLTNQERGLLEAVAAQTAIALRNAQFYQSAQQKAERETLINEIRDKIQRTSNVESALKTAVRELGSALQSKQTIVNVKNRTTQATVTKAHGGSKAKQS